MTAERSPDLRAARLRRAGRAVERSNGRTVERSNKSYCCPAHKQLAYRLRASQTVTHSVDSDGFEGDPLSEATQLPPEAANASSAAPRTGKWPSWCEPSTRFATVRGEKLQLDWLAHSLGDPFARCRDLQASACPAA